MDAFYTLGQMAWANERCDHASLNRVNVPEAFSAALADVRLLEDGAVQFYRPATMAALALIELPAPDLDAVELKIELHKAHLEGGDFDQVAWPAIEADLSRLAA
jgi:hypothetical protein